MKEEEAKAARNKATKMRAQQKGPKTTEEVPKEKKDEKKKKYLERAVRKICVY